MPGKRGRPITIQSNDPSILRRREKTAERVRRYFERRRAERDNESKIVGAQSGQGGSDITPAPTPASIEIERPVSVVTLHSSASSSPQVSETPRNQGATRAWLGERDDDNNALQNGHDIATRDTQAIGYARVTTPNLEDNAVRRINAEHARDSTHQYDEPDRQGCDVDIETSIQSGQDEQAHSENQNSLLRRRQLAALRQRRFRDRQRTLRGLPPVIRKKKHQHMERLIDSTTGLDDQGESLIPTQPDNRNCEGQRPRLSHGHATIVPSRARTSQRTPDRPYVATNEAQRLGNTAACASDPQSCRCETSTYFSHPSTSENVGANTEDPSVRGSQAGDVRESGRGYNLDTHTSVSCEENQRHQSASASSVNNESLWNDPVKPSARRATAKKLCDQMLYGFQGCS